ncbi:MAG: hypothetical protein LBC67_04895 [Spirochaetales bacterium]|jgi:hypothetical protein|nr:hypothetical protein [Spirochaetales bacterium]
MKKATFFVNGLLAALTALVLLVASCAITPPPPARDESQNHIKQLESSIQSQIENGVSIEKIEAQLRDEKYDIYGFSTVEKVLSRSKPKARKWAEQQQARAKDSATKAAEERAPLEPHWNAEDFGKGSAVASVFNVANSEELSAAFKSIDAGGNDKNYVIYLIGKITIDSITFTRVHSKVAISLRSGSTGEDSLQSSFTVSAGETLISRDITLDGRVNIAKGGTFTMLGGNIGDTRNINVNTYVSVEGGTFVMSGGNINGNRRGLIMSRGGTSVLRDRRPNNSGGVAVKSGIFTMSGGTISGNGNISSGGGVFVSEGGTFSMSGGTISDNIGDGGGVFVSKSGTFSMSGGTIGGNSSSNNTVYRTTGNGGGVFISKSGTFTMSGGTIYGSDAKADANKAYNKGAALYCEDRNNSKYGNGALILADYRVNYIDDTITGKK